jgi:hypothetical protein
MFDGTAYIKMLKIPSAIFVPPGSRTFPSDFILRGDDFVDLEGNKGKQ